MWAMNFRAWRPEMRERIEELVGQDASVTQDVMGWTDPRAIHHARVQGNPLYDAAMCSWHESIAGRRAETANYTIPGVQDYMDVLGNAILRSESPYIIDADDPELIEFGEDGMEERLTSHLADLLKDPETWPEDEIEAWSISRKYFENMMFHTMEQGWARQGLAQSILRQQLGFPYEWPGARID